MRTRSLALGPLVLAMAACRGDSTSPSATTPVGAWHLTNFGGHSLPYDIGDGHTLTADTLYLNRDGSYRESGYYVANAPDAQSYVFTSLGTWAIDAETSRITAQSSNLGNTWAIMFWMDSLGAPGTNVVYRR